jgi:hypothetical protein
MKREYRPPRPRRWSVPLVVIAAHLCIGWSGPTVHHVAWTAVDFFPSDLARQVRRHDDRFNAGIRRGLAAPPAWRAGPPGSLPRALEAQVRSCAADLRKPVPLADLVEEIGVLAVLVLDVNDPLAAIHDDPREASYAAAYQSYVNSVLGKLRLVYYGQNYDLIYKGAVTATIESAFGRSGSLYPFIGEEFYRTGELRDWRVLDDRSVTFGVAGVSLSRQYRGLRLAPGWGAGPDSETDASRSRGSDDYPLPGGRFPEAGGAGAGRTRDAEVEHPAATAIAFGIRNSDSPPAAMCGRGRGNRLEGVKPCCRRHVIPVLR